LHCVRDFRFVFLVFIVLVFDLGVLVSHQS
jgi:hypothetical protein